MITADQLIEIGRYNKAHGINGEISITDVDDSTENALFVVENEGKTVYIPISEDFITEIDEQGKTIEMDLPEGILDL